MGNEQMKASVFIPQARTIDIVDQNDNLLGTFEVQKDEIEILEKFSSIQSISRQKNFKDDLTSQVKLLTDAKRFIDEILGEGALKKITGGKSIGLSYIMVILQTVITELMRVNTENLAADYE